MKIFLDTEFTGLHQHAKLLSVALVAEDDSGFYAEFNDVDYLSLNDWMQQNVVSELEFKSEERIFLEKGNSIRCKDDTENIAKHVLDWLSAFKSVEMWADVGHYDWVFFCELFGGTLHLPKNMSYMCMDLATLLRVKGYDTSISRITLLNKEEMPGNFHAHNALSDAKLGMAILKKLL